MTALAAEHMALLTQALESEHVGALPPLLANTSPAEEQRKKNLSRSFSAFALRHIAGITAPEASRSVVDDFEDYGIDAIYYHAASETLFLVQAKLKAGEQFQNAEALAFCQGVRKLLMQDFQDFNAHVQRRLNDIEGAVDDCSHIRLAVAHVGPGLSQHARETLEEFLSGPDVDDDRLREPLIDYNASCVLRDLRHARAHDSIDTDIRIERCGAVMEPRETYFGLVRLADLVALHQKHDKSLYDRNIRSFLGHETEVNASIQRTLAENPEHFQYFNNGITAIGREIFPKAVKRSDGGRRRLKVHGLSIVNGAQTIASAATFVAKQTSSSIAAAKVGITLIKADADGAFGKAVTRARNHQNPVLGSYFAALDDEQERIRRDASYLGIRYVYKAGASDGSSTSAEIRIEEAAQALALFQADPRFVIWLKKEPSRLLDTESEQYALLFNSTLSVFQLINAVRFNRYVQRRLSTETAVAYGRERLAYKHGSFALAWILAKRVRSAAAREALFDPDRLRTELSAPFDSLRSTHWQKVEPAISFRGPLALFRSQTLAIPVIRAIAVTHFGLDADPVLEHKEREQRSNQPYPVDLFSYLVSRAPQIGNLG